MHVDDWLDRVPMPHEVTEAEAYARFFLDLFRWSETKKLLYACYVGPIKETLFRPVFCVFRGQKYRVTGCSRMGDVWLSVDSDQVYGYDYSVNIEECGEWSLGEVKE